MVCPEPDPSRAPPRSLTTTRAPSSARSSAYSRPSPPPAPVMMTTLPSSPAMPLIHPFTRVISLHANPCRVRPSEQFSHDLHRPVGVRGVDESEVGLGRLGQHGAAMAQRFEPPTAVVCAHSAGSHSAKGQLRD